MKKTPAVILCLLFAFTLSGCETGTIIDRFVSTGDTPANDNSPAQNPRVYMDELAGKLQDFNGSFLTVISQDQSYVFDVSQATLECRDGMITGDKISVIYEGRLSDTDTSTVKALKVVDEFHKKNRLKDRTAHGEVLGLTPNTITIKAQSGKTATYPITGTKQYYQNGITTGSWVYLHFKGKFPESDSDDQTVLNASHLKVLSVSDIDPFEVPAPTPTPKPEEQPSGIAEKQFRAEIQGINFNILQVLPDNSQVPLNIDLSSLPSYFKGGTAPGSYVHVTYTGEFNGTTLDGISLLAVTGVDPDTLKESRITSTITGTVIGTTSNTITIQTTDGALATCQTDRAKNATAEDVFLGNGVRITFNPSSSKESNIYECLKIEDA